VAEYIRRSTGTNETFYLLKDHLGSTEMITNSSGAQMSRLALNAWGARRNGATWVGNPTAGEWTTITNTTRQAFTSHEMLDNLNLTHMNGRVYDQVLGRFLSADPFIDGVGSTQGWNRYSYVHNNPLSWVDPSGFNKSEADADPDAPWYDRWLNPDWDFHFQFPAIFRFDFSRYVDLIPERCSIHDPARASCDQPLPGGSAGIPDSTNGGFTADGYWEPPLEEPLRGGFMDLLRQLNGGCNDGTVNCLTFPMWGTPRAALPVGSLAARSVSGLDDLALFRVYGINAHGQQVTLRANAVTRTHAEGDAFQQAANAGARSSTATLYVDKVLCGYCGTNGGVAGLARQLGVTELTVVTPQGIQIIRIGL
jgi:RHS repeat-associated protein